MSKVDNCIEVKMLSSGSCAVIKNAARVKVFGHTDAEAYKKACAYANKIKEKGDEQYIQV